MKPDWDNLGTEYEGSNSVIIADVDCTVEADLCGQHDVKGYPTIKYYNAETGRAGASYNGGRDLAALKQFTEENLSKACDAESLENCDDRERKFIESMKAKSAEERTTERGRLEKMKDGKMKPDQRKWLGQRLNILTQL